MRIAATFLLVVLVGACAPAPSPSADVPAQPVSAAANDGPYRLTFELPRSTWSTAEVIEGKATLALTQGDLQELGGSGGGVIAFGFREIGGTRSMGPAMQGDCATHELRADRPITSPITKSGGWSADDEHAAFYQAFFATSGVTLPAGQWEITAMATFIEGAGCAGRSVELSAPITITVAD